MAPAAATRRNRASRRHPRETRLMLYAIATAVVFSAFVAYSEITTAGIGAQSPYLGVASGE